MRSPGNGARGGFRTRGTLGLVSEGVIAQPSLPMIYAPGGSRFGPTGTGTPTTPVSKPTLPINPPVIYEPLPPNLPIFTEPPVVVHPSPPSGGGGSSDGGGTLTFDAPQFSGQQEPPVQNGDVTKTGGWWTNVPWWGWALVAAAGVAVVASVSRRGRR